MALIDVEPLIVAAYIEYLGTVCAWLGNSPKIAQRSYLLVTSADFQKAISTPQKSGTKSGTIKVKSGTISGTASVPTESQEIANHQENKGET